MNKDAYQSKRMVTILQFRDKTCVIARPRMANYLRDEGRVENVRKKGANDVKGVGGNTMQLNGQDQNRRGTGDLVDNAFPLRFHEGGGVISSRSVGVRPVVRRGRRGNTRRKRGHQDSS